MRKYVPSTEATYVKGSSGRSLPTCSSSAITLRHEILSESFRHSCAITDPTELLIRLTAAVFQILPSKISELWLCARLRIPINILGFVSGNIGCERSRVTYYGIGVSASFEIPNLLYYVTECILFFGSNYYKSSLLGRLSYCTAVILGSQ